MAHSCPADIWESGSPRRQLLVKRGNPFFLEETVRTLVETKALAGERGRYHVTQSLQAIQVPRTVRAMLAARIDRLAPEDKRLLQTASVVGKDVPFALLRRFAKAAANHTGPLGVTVEHRRQAPPRLFDLFQRRKRSPLPALSPIPTVTCSVPQRTAARTAGQHLARSKSSPTHRHPSASQIMARHGKLLPQEDEHGAGTRWTMARERERRERPPVALAPVTHITGTPTAPICDGLEAQTRRWWEWCCGFKAGCKPDGALTRCVEKALGPTSNPGIILFAP